MKEYVLVNRHKTGKPFRTEEGIEIIRRQALIPYGDARLLVWEKKINSAIYTIIAGYTVGDIYRRDDRCEAVKCDDVPEDKKDEVTQLLLKHKFPRLFQFESSESS